jgi:isopenicillin N synthase-like dioxygenase
MASDHIVPVIDVAPFLAGDSVGTQEVVRQVGHACETIGFLVLTGHGVDPEETKANHHTMIEAFSR